MCVGSNAIPSSHISLGTFGLHACVLYNVFLHTHTHTHTHTHSYLYPNGEDVNVNLVELLSPTEERHIKVHTEYTCMHVYTCTCTSTCITLQHIHVHVYIHIACTLYVIMCCSCTQYTYSIVVIHPVMEKYMYIHYQRALECI